MPDDQKLKTFKASLVTPDALILETEVAGVNFPAHDGMIGILTHRAPLLTKLGNGPLTLHTAAGETKTYFIRGGYAQMKDNILTILTDEAKTEQTAAGA